MSNGGLTGDGDGEGLGLGVGPGVGEGVGVGFVEGLGEGDGEGDGFGVGVGVGLGVGVATLTTAGMDRMPLPIATISAFPELTALASPLESIVTTAGLFETQLNITSESS